MRLLNISHSIEIEAGQGSGSPFEDPGESRVSHDQLTEISAWPSSRELVRVPSREALLQIDVE